MNPHMIRVLRGKGIAASLLGCALVTEGSVVVRTFVGPFASVRATRFARSITYRFPPASTEGADHA